MHDKIYLSRTAPDGLKLGLLLATRGIHSLLRSIRRIAMKPATEGYRIELGY